MNKKGVKYVNAFAELITPNTIKMTKKNGESETVTAKNIIVSVGGRPLYPDIPGKSKCLLGIVWLC